MENQQKELMLKFLFKNYPVYRIKHNMKFKRAIILDNNNMFLLSNKFESKELYTQLLKIIQTVFSADEKINKDVLKTFLNLK